MQVAHPAYATLVIPQVDSGHFYSIRELRQRTSQGHDVDYSVVEAEERYAWNQREPNFKTTVTDEERNLMGAAFGGRIIGYHIKAALAAAAQSASATFSAPSSLRVNACKIKFDAPIFVGDEVRCFAERISEANPATTGDTPRVECSRPPCLEKGGAWCGPSSFRFRVRLVVKRQEGAGGIAGTPLSIMEVGSSEVSIERRPLFQPTGEVVKKLGPLNISRLVSSSRDRIEVKDFEPTTFSEAYLYRVLQVGAGADIACYLRAREELLGAHAGAPIVTRDISLVFFDRAYRESATRSPLELRAPQITATRARDGKIVCAVQGNIGSSFSIIARVAAKMVCLARGG